MILFLLYGDVEVRIRLFLQIRVMKVVEKHVVIPLALIPQLKMDLEAVVVDVVDVTREHIFHLIVLEKVDVKVVEIHDHISLQIENVEIRELICPRNVVEEVMEHREIHHQDVDFDDSLLPLRVERRDVVLELHVHRTQAPRVHHVIRHLRHHQFVVNRRPRKY
jgi:hypothetical protein